MSDNPYAPPRSHVADPNVTLPDGSFVQGGRSVPSGRGWGWIVDAWHLMGAQRWTFIGVIVLYWILLSVASLVPGIGTLAVALFSPVITGGIMLGCDAVRRGEQLEVGHLFAGFQSHFGKLVAVGAIKIGLTLLIAIVVMIIAGASYGTMLLTGETDPEAFAGTGLTVLLAVLIAVAITLPLYMFVWFAEPLIVLGNLDVGGALKTSFRGCLRNIVPLIVFGVMVLVLAIPASIPLFLGWFVLGPVLVVSFYTSYRDIFYES